MQKSFIIIYATQTGQAKSIAERISELATKNNFISDLHCIDEYENDVGKLNKLDRPCVFICSTTGDGEVPEIAVKCYNRLKRQEKINKEFNLSNFSYALLGLGDTNYTQFCNGPKLFHKLFQNSKANCFYGPRWADDGTGLENEVEPFISGLWEAIDKELSHKSIINNISNLSLNTADTPLSSIELTIPQLTDQQVNFEYETDNKVEINERNFLNQIFNNNLLDAQLIDKTILTSNDAVKTCYKLKFKQILNENSVKFNYEPGHSIDIACPNDDNELNILFKCLNLTEIDIKKPIKIKQLDSKTKNRNLLQLIKLNEIGFQYNFYNLFKYYFDIRSNTLKKALIRMLAESCTNDYDKRCLLELCSQEGTQIYTELIKQNSISLCDLLQKYKSCKPKIDYLLQFLQPLQVRSYTLASCKDIDNDEMEIIFNLIKFDSTQSRTYDRDGVATGYLSKLNINDKFHFLKRTLQNFVLTDECLTSKPLIMIGPGTGIAPFISFIKYKLSNNNNNNNSEWLLYYGCRDPNKDFLYKNELLNDYKNLLKNIYISFSRYNIDDTDDNNLVVKELIKNNNYKNEFKYVQDALKFSSNEICDLILNHNASIYICGDARNMSKDVFACLCDCLKGFKNDNSFDSNKYLIEMMSTKRYRQDIWS